MGNQALVNRNAHIQRRDQARRDQALERNAFNQRWAKTLANKSKRAQAVKALSETPDQQQPANQPDEATSQTGSKSQNQTTERSNAWIWWSVGAAVLAVVVAVLVLVLCKSEDRTRKTRARPLGP